MTVVATIEINGIEQRNTDLEIGAFHGEECRGSEILAYYSGFDRYFLFFTLYGDYGDPFTFRLYDHSSQQELDLECSNSLAFSPNAMYGDPNVPYVFSFTGGNCTITATADPLEGGSVEGAGTFVIGESCTLTATANPSYRFVEWLENGDSIYSEPVFTFPATTDRTLTARFEMISYSVEVNVTPEGTGVVEGAGEYFDGETCTLSATPNADYRFEAWQEDGTILSTESEYSFVVQSDHNITALFALDGYMIEAEADPLEGGNITGSGFYHEGELCILQAESNPGYAFVNWTEDSTVVGEEPTLSFSVENYRHLVAHFERLVYHISLAIEPENGGAAIGDGDYYYGDMAALHATPAPDFYFIHWEEDGEVVSTNADYQFVVDSDRSLVALFALDAYLVDAVADPAEGGIIYGAGYYPDGVLCTLSAEPRQGYAFINWTEDDVVVSDEPAFSFVVETEHHFVAHFEHVVYHITVAADPEEGGTVMGGGDFYYGETCNVEAMPAYNYNFLRWKENGGTVSENPSYSFVVIRNRNLVAVFDYYDGIVETHDVGYTAFCKDHRVIVTNPKGEMLTPKQIIDSQGRMVRNDYLTPGTYLVPIEGNVLKTVVE